MVKMSLAFAHPLRGGCMSGIFIIYLHTLVMQAQSLRDGKKKKKLGGTLFSWYSKVQHCLSKIENPS